ncbi:DEAD/DEAH box helicase [Halobacteriovorax sp. DPLXC-1]|uniref:DEAD/DEAH box helicase n=1 Tax=Halobacteriovorax sp. DPLXC-1 TaxID=3110771 RepID=UPI002FF21FED
MSHKGVYEDIPSIRDHFLNLSKIEIYHLGTDTFNGEVEDNFSFFLEEIELWLFFKISSNNYSIRIHRGLTEFAIPVNAKKILTLSNIEIVDQRSKINDNEILFNKIYKEISDNICENDEITEGHIVSTWQKLIDIEEKILKKQEGDALKLTISNVLSKGSKRAIVDIEGEISSLKKYLDEDYILKGIGEDHKNSTRIQIVRLLGNKTVEIGYDGHGELEVKVGQSLNLDITGKKIQFVRKKNAVNRLLRGDTVNKELKNLLVKPQFITSSLNIESINKWYSRLSESSQKVVESAISQDDFYIIQGPPGTGKTTIISELTQQLVARGEKVLVTSQANLAVDNVIDKIGEISRNSELNILRYGHSSKIESEAALSKHLNCLTEEIRKDSRVRSKELIDSIKDFSPSQYTEDDINNLETFYYLRKDFVTAQNNVNKTEKTLINLNREYELLQDELSSLQPKWDDISGLTVTNEWKDIFELFKKTRIKKDYLEDLYRKTDESQTLKLKSDKINEDIIEMKNDISRLMAGESEIDELRRRAKAKASRGFFGEIFDVITSDTPSDINRRLNDIHQNIAKAKELKLKIPDLENELTDINERVTKLKDRLFKISNGASYIDLLLINRLKSLYESMYELSEETLSFNANDIAEVISKVETLSSKKSFVEESLKNNRAILTEKKSHLKEINSDFKMCYENIKGFFNESTLKDLSLDTINDLKKEVIESTQNAKLGKCRDIIENYIKENTFNSRDDEIFENYIKSKANVVMTTCSQTASRNFEDDFPEFDTVILDEASKSLPTELFIPLLKGKRIILVGDHKQLGPYIEKEMIQEFHGVEKTIVEKTMFEYLYQNVPEENKVMLNTQYRMPLEISALVGKAFYNDLLVNGKHKCRFDIDRILIIPNNSAEEKYKNSYVNHAEVFQIEQVVKQYISKLDGQDFTIGIISMYRAQKEILSKSFESFHNVEVGTVDSFQGKEKDIIILSTVRTNGNPGHMKDIRRVNVALSRAKEGLVIVGDKNTLIKSPGFEKVFQILAEKLKAVA